MAAFTEFSREALERYLVMFDLGKLSHFEAISAGIENSNYFLTISDIQYVLTINESLSFDETGFFNHLLETLAQAGLPVPEPHKTLDGMSSTTFCRKPTWLFPRLPGGHISESTESLCFELGTYVARMHNATQEFRYHRANPYNSDWVTQALEIHGHRVGEADLTRLIQVAEEYSALSPDLDLPRGIIHGDLFVDNVLFEDDKITGIIDFYHACDDYLIQDIAITMNDWCRQGRAFDSTKTSAFLEGYQSVRELTEQELQWLPTFQKFGALRFALTRLESGEQPLKDPQEFIDLLQVISNESL